MTEKKNLSFLRAAVFFGAATGYFYLLLFTLFPFLKSHFVINPSLYWFITGYFLFIPLFLYSIIMARGEGNRSTTDLLQSLSIKKLSKKDWRYTVVATVVIFVLSGMIFGCSALLNQWFGIGLLK